MTYVPARAKNNTALREDDGGEGKCFVGCLSCMRRYLCYVLCVRVCVSKKKKMFQRPQSFQFLIRVWLHICIKSGGLDLWWSLPEECFRGRGRAARRACFHVSEAAAQPPVRRLRRRTREEGEQGTLREIYTVMNKFKTEEGRKREEPVLYSVCQLIHS